MRVVFKTAFPHIGHVHRLFCSDQTQRSQQDKLLFVKIERTYRLGFIQYGLALLQHRNQFRRFLVGAGTGGLGEFGKMAFDRREIGQREFGVDGLNVRQRIDFAGDVDNVFIFETAHDMRNRISLANVGEELVAETFALGRTCDQPRDVDEFHDRRHHLFRLDDDRQRSQAWVRHFDDADIGLDGAERVVFRRDTRLGQRIEQGGFADIGQADDAAFQRHDE